MQTVTAGILVPRYLGCVLLQVLQAVEQAFYVIVWPWHVWP